MRKICSIFIVTMLSLFLFYVAISHAEERLTLTTYYPAPYGVYKEIRADQMAVGSPYRNTPLSDGKLLVSGNAGIGTTNPNKRLVVEGDVSLDAADSSTLLTLGFSTQGNVVHKITSHRGTGEMSVNAGELSFKAGAGPAEQMRITGSGVGIGTPNPSVKLQVNGDVRISGDNSKVGAMPGSTIPLCLETYDCESHDGEWHSGGFFGGQDAATCGNDRVACGYQDDGNDDILCCKLRLKVCD